MEVRFLSAGDTAMVVEFGDRIDRALSDRVLRLVSVVNQATQVLGSQQAAEQWLSSPAIGLDRRIPIDLLQSSEGTAMVKTLLSRMEYGVYA